MALLDFLRKDEVIGSTVLVCGLDARFEELADGDSQIYKRFYRATTTRMFNTGSDLVAALQDKYDIIHLFCDVLNDGTLLDSEGGTISGTALLEHSCAAGVKLVWIANGNPSDRYINGFNARGKRVNVVMTLDRNGAKFSEFLDKMLFRMFYGDSMPVAWADLCPQVPGTQHPDAPVCIFWAGRGSVKLR
jgi:hypothetical protein